MLIPKCRLHELSPEVVELMHEAAEGYQDSHALTDDKPSLLRVPSCSGMDMDTMLDTLAQEEEAEERRSRDAEQSKRQSKRAKVGR